MVLRGRQRLPVNQMMLKQLLQQQEQQNQQRQVRQLQRKRLFPRLLQAK
jgi:hypothetical protein